jgi:Tol biopolymer transport system component
MKRLSAWVFAVGLPCLLVLAFPAAGGGSGAGSGRIVFVRADWCKAEVNDCGRGDVAVVNPDGSGLRVLTHERAAVRVSESSPSWSPDRREIAYIRPFHSAGRAGAHVWLMAADGTHQRALTHSGPAPGNVDWAPNGRQIVFTYGPSLWVANVRTGAVRVLKRTRFMMVDGAAWSPNGRWIAFVGYQRGEAPGTTQIFLLSTVTHLVHQLTHTAKNYPPLGPAWSPDSRRIAFNYHGKIYVINADGTHLHSLNAVGWEPSWSPDGQWIVFNYGGNLQVMRANGSNRHLITHAPNPKWVNDQPDW